MALVSAEGGREQQRVRLPRSLLPPSFPPVRLTRTGDTVIHLMVKLESHRGYSLIAAAAQVEVRKSVVLCFVIALNKTSDRAE